MYRVPMYRLLSPSRFMPILASVLLSACAMGQSSLTSGFAGDPAPETASVSKTARSGGLGGEPSSTSRASKSAEQKVAALDTGKTTDQAPSGSFAKAPAGALADRDFSAANLDAEKVREAINAYRKQNGLKPLKLNASLTEAAKAHSRDLAKWDRISHYGSDGSNPWDRVKRTGYNAKLAAENVGTGQASVDEVMKGWKESPGHNKNLLLADAEHMGIALVQDPKTEFKTFWTLVVGSSL